jgi:hypothetical protein
MARRKSDKRLLGTWQSDRRRTMKNWRWPRGASTQYRKRFAAIFGKLRIRYTRQKIYSELNGDLDSLSYEVIAADPESVAIRCKMGIADECERITHIHFEGDKYYWITIGPNLVEWFKRINSK